MHLAFDRMLAVADRVGEGKVDAQSRFAEGLGHCEIAADALLAS